MPRPGRDSLARVMLLAVGAALVLMQALSIADRVWAERKEIELVGQRRADAALDILAAAHAQAMRYRGDASGRGTATTAFNDAMAQLAQAGHGIELWMVMAPKVVARQRARHSAEIEPARDGVDVAALAQRSVQRQLIGGTTLRVTRPIILGQDAAAEPGCVDCHAQAMHTDLGEPIGAYSAAVDLRPELAAWRRWMAREIVGALLTVALTLGLIALLLRATAVQPLRRLAQATERLAKGEMDVVVPGKARGDEIGVMARALGVFRASLIATRRLQGETAAAVQALRASEARFRDIAEAASDWLWETDDRCRLTYLSERFAAVTGRSAAAVLGQPLDELLSSIPGEPTHGIALVMAQREPFRALRRRYAALDGRPRVCELAGRPLLDENNAFLGYRGIASDITAEVEAQHLARHDALTDLPNRTLLAERFEQVVAGLRRHGGAAALLCLDLDHFKAVNDTLGHCAGDLLLKELAIRLRGLVRETDLVARLGGDEFAILQVGIDGVHDVEDLCRRLLAAFAAPVTVQGRELFATLSIGVAMIPDDGTAAADVLKNADVALHRAKAEGRATFRFFAAGTDLAQQARQALEDDLRQALLNGRLQLHYQPLIDVGSDRVIGVEALARWHDPLRGWVSPGEFIPVAEASGLILPLGEWVLRTACRQAASWPDVVMAVNLSPVQFRSPEIVDVLRQILAETGLPASRLELEITENVMLEDTEAVLAKLQALQAMGLRIAMDDFGTGYSSLSYLRSFPFDKLKIDQSFVRTLEQDPNAAPIVRAVLGLGRSLGMTTTAEGVESARQLAFLRREGCDQAQGYHLGRPQDAESITRLLHRAPADLRPALVA